MKITKVDVLQVQTQLKKGTGVQQYAEFIRMRGFMETERLLWPMGKPRIPHMVLFRISPDSSLG